MERDKKWAQRLGLQQDARAVSGLRARNTACQHSRRESLLPQAASVIRDCNTARERSLRVSLPPQAASVIRDRNAASQRSSQNLYFHKPLLPQPQDMHMPSVSELKDCWMLNAWLQKLNVKATQNLPFKSFGIILIINWYLHVSKD